MHNAGKGSSFRILCTFHVYVCVGIRLWIEGVGDSLDPHGRNAGKFMKRKRIRSFMLYGWKRWFKFLVGSFHTLSSSVWFIQYPPIMVCDGVTCNSIGLYLWLIEAPMKVWGSLFFVIKNYVIWLLSIVLCYVWMDGEDNVGGIWLWTRVKFVLLIRWT